MRSVLLEIGNWLLQGLERIVLCRCLAVFPVPNLPFVLSLIMNEGAVTRLAGVMVGAFVIVELLLFQDWIALIPKAVFIGALIKAGVDVFDWHPLKIYWREVRGGRVPENSDPQKRPGATHLSVLLILGHDVGHSFDQFQCGSGRFLRHLLPVEVVLAHSRSCG